LWEAKLAMIEENLDQITDKTKALVWKIKSRRKLKDENICSLVDLQDEETKVEGFRKPKVP
jgi:hypothetical protein